MESPAIQLHIRQIIFEKYNDPDTKFTNDEVFADLQKNSAAEKSLMIDDMEPHFAALCDAGLMRNIAQNFTTQWFKIFEPLEKVNCQSCHKDMHVNKSEEKTCPGCGNAI
jgi:hypothetical protein